jgi:hypothetical protein
MKTVFVDGGPASMGENMVIHPSGLKFPDNKTSLTFKLKSKKNTPQYDGIVDTVDGAPMKVQTSDKHEIVRKREYLTDDARDASTSFTIAPLGDIPRHLVSEDNNTVTDMDVARQKALHKGEVDGWMKLARSLMADPSMDVSVDAASDAAAAPNRPMTYRGLPRGLFLPGTSHVDVRELSASTIRGVPAYFLTWAWAIAKRFADSEPSRINKPIAVYLTGGGAVSSYESWPVAIQFMRSERGHAYHLSMDDLSIRPKVANNDGDGGVFEPPAGEEREDGIEFRPDGGEPGDEHVVDESEDESISDDESSIYDESDDESSIYDERDESMSDFTDSSEYERIPELESPPPTPPRDEPPAPPPQPPPRDESPARTPPPELVSDYISSDDDEQIDPSGKQIARSGKERARSSDDDEQKALTDRRPRRPRPPGPRSTGAIQRTMSRTGKSGVRRGLGPELAAAPALTQTQASIVYVWLMHRIPYEVPPRELPDLNLLSSLPNDEVKAYILGFIEKFRIPFDDRRKPNLLRYVLQQAAPRVRTRSRT